MKFLNTVVSAIALTTAAVSSSIVLSEPAAAQETNIGAETRYGTEDVAGVEIFFREAGDPTKPTLVLLHGFPASSHQYRELLRELGDDYYLIAPDYPGFGASEFRDIDEYEYSFDNIANTIDAFLEQRGITKFSLFIQDYGAPIGMRIATRHPERIQSLIVQNGNLYEEGLNEETWAPIMELWQSGLGNTALKEQIAASVFSLEGLKWQYTHGTRNPDAILPDNWLLDYRAFSRPGQHEMQLQLFYDYRNNVAKYPEWQAYLREHQPPALIVWAKNDAFFPEPGAQGFQRDLNDVDYNILDTGHFALEEDGDYIATKIRTFLYERGIR